MRTLFWRVFLTFWIAVLVAAALAAAFGHLFNRDDWVIQHHPGIDGLAEQWVETYEGQGADAAQQLLLRHHRERHVDIQVLDEHGQALVPGTVPPRALVMEQRRARDERSRRGPPWRRLTEEYVAPSGETYLFIYRLPFPELAEWQRDSLLLPAGLFLISLVVLTAFSLLLTLSITRPLNRLRHAVHELGQNSYQKESLEQLSGRQDELGVLARDFSSMGVRLQMLIASQRQLLHDVSHELRSPLARLRIALALADREGVVESERQRLSRRIARECDRLEALIAEILVLARVDAGNSPSQPVELSALFARLVEDARLQWPAQAVCLQVANACRVDGWPELLERAVDNLLRNALRFNPGTAPVELSASVDGQWLCIRVRDHGPGVDASHLARLGEPFYRAPGQAAAGHGLGLAIARRAAERHGGQLLLANAAEGGFIASLLIPRSRLLD